MNLIADALLAAGAFGAAMYCYILSQRLSRLQRLESGMGGAVAVLSAQVDDMTRALERARVAASGQAAALDGATTRGTEAAARLEVLLSTLHDVEAHGNRASPLANGVHATGRRIRVTRSRPLRGADEVLQ
jgi:hypothetical protein